MGRSVNYLNNAEFVIYFPTPDYQEVGQEYDEFLGQLAWRDLVQNLICEIKAKLPSYNDSYKWDNRETRVILENQFCLIGLSKYCGLCSLSIACKDGDSYWPDNKAYYKQFSKHHAEQIEKTLEKIIEKLGLTRLVKQGTFSNGESVYKEI